jgi:tellurite resistance protein TerB
MDDGLQNKLAEGFRRYQDKDFLKAVVAVCALAANADDEVDISERYKIEEIIAQEPPLREFEAKKAAEIFDAYVDALRQEGESAKKILYNKVRRMAGDQDKSRTLMCAAYLVIVADHEILEQEKLEFERLCTVLDLDPSYVWRELGA